MRQQGKTLVIIVLSAFGLSTHRLIVTSSRDWFVLLGIPPIIQIDCIWVRITLRSFQELPLPCFLVCIDVCRLRVCLDATVIFCIKGVQLHSQPLTL